LSIQDYLLRGRGTGSAGCIVAVSGAGASGTGPENQP